MIAETLYPRTKSDLVRAVQRMQIDRISIVEPYDKSRDADIAAALNELSRGSGNVTVVILRTR
jgi:hypothetical protein